MLDEEELPSFSGALTVCPKCGCREVTVTYHECGMRGGRWACTMDDPRLRTNREHLCRRCKSCGYGWMEAVVPAAVT